MACYGEGDVVIPCEQWYAQHNAQVAITGQVGSQWWMDYDPFGTGVELSPDNEPDLATKLLTTDGGSADYARDIISQLAPDWYKTNGYPVPDPANIRQFYTNNPDFIMPFTPSVVDGPVTAPSPLVNVSGAFDQVKSALSGSNGLLIMLVAGLVAVIAVSGRGTRGK